MEQGKNDLEQNKERSPNFPFISLQRAIDRTRQLADFHKRSATRVSVIGATWGYGPKSSGLIQTVAALRAFGLIEDTGRGEDRRVAISELGWRILSDSRPHAREDALREAALKPRLIAEYAEKWLPDRPSDKHCISELVLDRGFTDGAAKLFLKVFDDTIVFANLKIDDKQISSRLDSAPSSEINDGPRDFSTMWEVLKRLTNRHPDDPVLKAKTSEATEALRRISPRLDRAVTAYSGISPSVWAGATEESPVISNTLVLPEGDAVISIPRQMSKVSRDTVRAVFALLIDLVQEPKEAAPSSKFQTLDDMPLHIGPYEIKSTGEGWHLFLNDRIAATFLSQEEAVAHARKLQKTDYEEGAESK